MPDESDTPMRLALRRRTVLAGAGSLALPAIIGSARAQESKTIILGTWGGDYQRLLKENVEDPLLTPKGYEIIVEAGTEPQRLAKIQATKMLKRGPYDVACMGPATAVLLNGLGLLETLDESKVPNLKYVREGLAMPFFAPHIWSPQVLTYNPERVPTPPVTFSDLLDAKYKDKVGFPDDNGQYVLMAASLYASGTTTDFDKAKELLIKLNANGLRLYPSTDSAGPPFKSGELDVGVMWFARTVMWQNAGIPVKASFPKEGCVLYISGMAVPKNAPNKEGAFAYLNAMLEPPGQIGFAKNMGYSPTVTNVTLPGAVADQLALPVPPPKLVPPDFAYNAKILPDLLDWWKKTIQHT
jgi:putative spermidine/putrescine transport system substrate-binding protein